MQPTLQKNDKKAHILIWIFSIIVFLAVTILDRITLEVNLGFDPHIFAKLSAGVNSIVTVLIVIALILVKQKKYELHKKLMMITMILSVLFLVFYIAHHLFTGETKYGDIDHNGILEDIESTAVSYIPYLALCCCNWRDCLLDDFTLLSLKLLAKRLFLLLTLRLLYFIELNLVL